MVSLDDEEKRERRNSSKKLKNDCAQSPPQKGFVPASRPYLSIGGGKDRKAKESKGKKKGKQSKGKQRKAKESKGKQRKAKERKWNECLIEHDHLTILYLCG